MPIDTLAMAPGRTEFSTGHLTHSEWSALLKNKLDKQAGFHFCVSKQPLMFDCHRKCFDVGAEGDNKFHCFRVEAGGTMSYPPLFEVRAENAFYTAAIMDELCSVVFLDFSPEETDRVKRAVTASDFELFCEATQELLDT